MGVERAIPEDLRQRQPARSEVHRLWGYYYLDPVDPSIFTFDGESGEYSGGGGGQCYADRTRNQLQVSFTKYANKFGRHSLKFGAEIERSHVRSQYQPYGPAGVYIYAYGGVPYYGVSYGYDVQGDNRRTSAYVQDQWQAGRMTLNIGLRLDHLSGFSPVLDETVYKPNTSWGPRVGMACDLTGKGTSAIKAFWGRYFEGAASAFYTQATPGCRTSPTTRFFRTALSALPKSSSRGSCMASATTSITRARMNSTCRSKRS